MRLSNRAPTSQQPQGPSPSKVAVSEKGVEANSRLTAMTAAVLLVLFAVEGLTIVRIHSLLSVHVVVGMIVAPPALLKMTSTGYRFVRYYTASPSYRAKGPPPALLRVLGPVVVVSTVVLLGSGIALLFVGQGARGQVLDIHRDSFFLWFVAMAVHVLGHILDTWRIAPRDWLRRSRTDISGARLRQWAVAASVAVGIPLGLLFLNRAHSWFSPFPH